MHEEAVGIEWTKPMLKRLKMAYAEAVENETPEFTFLYEKGKEPVGLVVAYAKYLIEYLEGKLGDA